jgi:hypothetical protein
MTKTPDDMTSLFETLDAAILKAVLQSRHAYEFAPDSYTYGAMTACLAAQAALGEIAKLSEAIDRERDVELQPEALAS